MCLTKANQRIDANLRCHFGGAKIPKPQPPPPKPPTPNDAASATRSYDLSARKGRASTILAGEGGGDYSSQRKTLLGS